MDIEMVCLHCLKTELHTHPTDNLQVALIDLDSTLCDISGRLHLAPHEDDRGNPEAWEKFHFGLATDRISPAVKALAQAFYFVGPVHLISSGRPRKYWKQTMTWLNRHGVRYDAIALRSDDDPDLKTFKPRYVEALKKAGISISLAVDDDPEAVSAYEEVGVPALGVLPAGSTLALTNAVSG